MTEVLEEQPFTAAKRVCEAFGVEVSARQCAAADSPAVEFRDLLEKLLVAKSPDLLAQLAAVLLPHVPEISPEDGAVEDLPGGDPMAQDAPRGVLLNIGYGLKCWVVVDAILWL